MSHNAPYPSAPTKLDGSQMACAQPRIATEKTIYLYAPNDCLLLPAIEKRATYLYHKRHQQFTITYYNYVILRMALHDATTHHAGQLHVA